jgi:hypothetical protein
MGDLNLIVEAPYLVGSMGSSVLERQRQAEALVTALKAIRGTGPVGLLASPSALLVSALAAMKPAERPELFALVPNVSEYMRDSTEKGLVGAALKRLKRANLTILFRLFCHGVAHAPRILSYDFGALLAILLELELAGLRLRPSAVVLAAPLTDLALAAANRDFFRFYATYVRRRHQARPCLETQNGGHLLARLRQWEVSIDSVVTPVNPKGYRMKPTKDACLAEMARTTVFSVIARDVTAGGAVSIEKGAQFAQSNGATRLVLDLASAENIAFIETHRAFAEAR